MMMAGIRVLVMEQKYIFLEFSEMKESPRCTFFGFGELAKKIGVMIQKVLV